MAEATSALTLRRTCQATLICCLLLLFFCFTFALFAVRCIVCASRHPPSSVGVFADARTEPCHHLSYIGLILLRNAIYHKVICLHCSLLACLEGFTAIHHACAPSKPRFNFGPNTPSTRWHPIMDCFVAPTLGEQFSTTVLLTAVVADFN